MMLLFVNGEVTATAMPRRGQSCCCNDALFGPRTLLDSTTTRRGSTLKKEGHPSRRGVPEKMSHPKR
jgi:hypothetical protein